MKKVVRRILALLVVLMFGTVTQEVEAAEVAKSMNLKDEVISVQYGSDFKDPWVEVKSEDGKRLTALEAEVKVTSIVFVIRDSEGKILERQPKEKLDTTCIGEWQITYTLESVKKFEAIRTVYVVEINWYSLNGKQRLKAYRSLSEEAQNKLPQNIRDLIYSDFCKELAGATASLNAQSTVTTTSISTAGNNGDTEATGNNNTGNNNTGNNNAGNNNAGNNNTGNNNTGNNNSNENANRGEDSVGGVEGNGNDSTNRGEDSVGTVE